MEKVKTFLGWSLEKIMFVLLPLAFISFWLCIAAGIWAIFTIDSSNINTIVKLIIGFVGLSYYLIAKDIDKLRAENAELRTRLWKLEGKNEQK